MEDNESTPSTTPPPAARTAQALRELHDRARSALAAQRERMGQLEAQLTNQLDSISETLAQQIASHGGTSGEAEQSLQDVEQLRAELERTRLEWDRERELWQAERGQLVAAEAGRSQSLDDRQQELDARQQTLDDRAAELNQQDREQRQRQELLDAHAAQAAEKQTELFANEDALEKRRAELAELDAELQKAQLELEQTREDLRAREQKLANEQAALANDQLTFANDQAAIANDRAALAAEREALQAERTEVAQTQTAMEAASQLTKTETASRLALLDSQLSSERTAWDRERASIEEQRKLLAIERDDLSTALEAARGELSVARADAAAAGELADVKQNFQSALEDVRRLTVRVEELETELDGRPVVNETDVVELVHLRAEREAMAQRISELEQQVSSGAGAAPSADMSDLQRRFELAMDDVRDLKKRNAELEIKLESKPGGDSAPSTGSVSGWEAMKLKMLANLEGEEDDGDEGRQKERLKIEDAIRHTDAALERKDRELADLKVKLADAANAPRDRDSAVEELVDADEVIAEHRTRIAALEAELTAKLREAELELSVERAKITRESAHLADLKAEIDAHRAAGGDPHAAPGTPQQPRRRWLSKLGLTGEDQE